MSQEPTEPTHHPTNAQADAPSLAPAPAPSPLQRKVLDFVRRHTGHAVVEATAGSGKTTTLVQLARLLPEAEPACFLAFNRATAAELRARLPAHVEATTIHALGRRMLVSAHPHLKRASPRPAKYRSLARELARQRGSDLGEPEELAQHLAHLSTFVRLELTDAHDLAAVAAVARRYRIESPVTAARLHELHALLPELLARGVTSAGAGVVDFTDMLHLPLQLGLEPPRYRFVCVDEAQDLSPLSLSLITRLVERGARALFVGDPHQAIYAFAGADRSSLARIVTGTGATVLPLSVSFRCPTRHVSLARRFSPRMEAAPGAGSGSVRLVSAGSLARLARPGDLVMSRVNAPLVELCLRLTEVGTPARVLGTDLVEPLLALARHLFERALPPGAAEVVARHARSEARRLERQLLTSPALAEALRLSSEQHQALGLLLQRLPAGRGASLERLERLARSLLVSADDPPPGARRPEGVVLSTIHKAKGREAERVFLLYPEELAPPAAGSPERDEGTPGTAPASSGDGLGEPAVDDEAEGNVLFVALTRSRSELYLVERSRGALAARLAAHRAERAGHRGPNDQLPHRWSEVLSLALLMSRASSGARWRRLSRPPRAAR